MYCLDGIFHFARFVKIVPDEFDIDGRAGRKLKLLTSVGAAIAGIYSPT